MFVITWDNGSGHREWACSGQGTEEQALAAAQITRKDLGTASIFDYRIEQVIVRKQSL